MNVISNIEKWLLFICFTAAILAPVIFIISMNVIDKEIAAGLYGPRKYRYRYTSAISLRLRIWRDRFWHRPALATVPTTMQTSTDVLTAIRSLAVKVDHEVTIEEMVATAKAKVFKPVESATTENATDIICVQSGGTDMLELVVVGRECAEEYNRISSLQERLLANLGEQCEAWRRSSQPAPNRASDPSTVLCAARKLAPPTVAENVTGKDASDEADLLQMLDDYLQQSNLDQSDIELIQIYARENPWVLVPLTSTNDTLCFKLVGKDERRHVEIHYRRRFTRKGIEETVTF